MNPLMRGFVNAISFIGFIVGVSAIAYIMLHDLSFSHEALLGGSIVLICWPFCRVINAIEHTDISER